MKKKVIIFMMVIVAFVCFFPLPRRVNCHTEDVQMTGWYLDYLFWTDRFYGEIEVEGHQYQPGENHAAYRFVTENDCIYMISAFRYRAETNDMEGKSIYLEENLEDLKSWN